MDIFQELTDEQAWACARSAMGGKRSAKVEARVTDEVKDALRRRCNELGMHESEFVNSLIEVSLFGFQHVSRMNENRLMAVMGSPRTSDDIAPAQRHERH